MLQRIGFRTCKKQVRARRLLHGLLELETLNDLLGHPVCGLALRGIASTT